MSKNSKQSEDVLFMVKHVRHKKVDGTLYVNSGRIAWRNQTSDSFRISAAFEDIRMQRVSLDSKEKVQLQLLMHSGESFTFHFADPAGQKKQIEARNKVKEVLQQMLPKFKDKAHVELNEKFCILESNPHLLALYKELVVTGILSSEEFWARPEFSQAKSVGSVESVASTASKDESVPPQWISSKGISRSLIPERPQVAGVPSCLLSDIKPEMDGANSIRYNLTKDSIDAIFRAYPAVRQRHKELVPDKLTEPEFWNKFFQSHYYHRDRAVINKDDIFNDCDEVDERMLHTEFLRCKRMRTVSHLDFENLEDHSVGEGYGLDLPEQPQSSSSSNSKRKGNTNQLLIHRFNKHSNLILRAQAKHTAMTAPTKPSTDSTYRDLASSGTLKRKLTAPAAATEDTDKKARESITLSVTKDYFQNPIAVNQALPVSQPLSQSQARQALAACQASLSMPNRGNRPTLNYADVQSAIADVSAGGCLTTGGKTSSGEKTAGAPSSVLMLLSSEQSKELSMLISAAGELLRHFWVCLPTTSVAMAEKIIRIHDSLLRFETNKLLPFIESIESTLSNAGVRGTGLSGSYRCQVTAHLESLINAAKTMFREWKAGQQRVVRS